MVTGTTLDVFHTAILLCYGFMAEFHRLHTVSFLVISPRRVPLPYPVEVVLRPLLVGVRFGGPILPLPRFGSIPRWLFAHPRRLLDIVSDLPPRGLDGLHVIIVRGVAGVVRPWM
jgi:hypothetical protein